MNHKQLDRLSMFLVILENNTLRETGVGRISGGFAHADMYGYDEDEIDIELKWGVHSDVENTSHVEHYRLPIDAVNPDVETFKQLEMLHQAD